MQCYLAEKVHCVWLVNGEMKVLFEYKQPDGHRGQLMSGPINLVINNELIQQYINSMDHIPHIRKTTTTALEQLLDFMFML